MTIAAGFQCIDGMVLAVDSQYTGGIAKTSGQKIFPLWQNDRYSVTLASAGSVAMAKRAVETFAKIVDERISSKSTTLEELRDMLEDALCVVHNKHVYPAPPDERVNLDFWLLMAAWTPSGYRLFRTDLTAVNPVYGSTCIGIGSYLGNYLTDVLCHYAPTMAVEDVKPIAAYVIKSAKGFVDGCGLSTFVRVLTDKGIDERIAKEEITDAEEFYENMFRSIRLCVEGAINVDNPLPDAFGHLSDHLDLLADAFRGKQSQRKEKIEARRRETQRLDRERVEKLTGR